MKKIMYFLSISFLLYHPLFAHSSDGGGFIAGLQHPVLGMDHLLAMISGGILSSQIGGKAIWTVPSTFVGIMLIGGILSMKGIPFFSVELGIACSVLALGLAIAIGKSVPTLIALALVSFFALFHGHAHGTEMPTLAQPALYALGFTSGTAGIHIAGVLIGVVAEQYRFGPKVLRFAGLVIAAIGSMLILK